MTTHASLENSVIQTMLRRRDGVRTPGSKLALVVEGGGMRGVYSGGALLALEQLGFGGVFDEVYAESAGAINASYFLAGQTQMGIRIYLEDLQTLLFLNPLRIAAILDIDYVVDSVLTQRKPLAVEAVCASRSDLFIAVTDALDGSARLVDVKRENLRLLTVLKATAAIVPLYNRAVLLEGRPYVDGGISNPIPIQSALDAGCTHVLVLLTRPPGYAMRHFTVAQQKLLSLALRGWTKEFIRVFYQGRPRRYSRARELAFGRAPCGASVAVIGPGTESPRMTRTTLAPAKLQLALQDSVLRTQAAFKS